MATILLIEPASANPLPSALHAYPVLKFNCQLPNRQGSLTAIPLGFSASIPDVFQRDSVWDDSGDLSVQTHVRPKALKQVIKLLVRSCRRWQL